MKLVLGIYKNQIGKDMPGYLIRVLFWKKKRFEQNLPEYKLTTTNKKLKI